MSEQTLTDAEKTLLRVLHDLARGTCAERIGDDGKLTRWDLHTVPTLLLCAILSDEIDSTALAMSGEPCTTDGILHRLHILKLVKHVQADPSDMRIKLWNGRILAVSVHRGEIPLLDSKLTVQEGKASWQTGNADADIRHAVKLTQHGYSVCQEIWGTDGGDDEWVPEKMLPAHGSKSTTTKLAKKHPTIRRDATVADRKHFNMPKLLFLYNKRRFYELTEGAASL
jgi:hypothetical protein